MISVLLTTFLLTTQFGGDLPFDLLQYAHEFQQDEGEQHILSEWQGGEVTVKGFLYRLDDGTCVLASEPELSSCCVGDAAKAGSQLIIDGLPDPINTVKALTVSGKFFIDLTRRADGTICQVYRLAEARVTSSGGVFPWIFIGSAIVVGCLAAAYIVSKRRRHRPVPRATG